MDTSSNDSRHAAAPTLSLFDRLLGRVEDLFGLVAAMFILGLMLLGVVQVLGRTVFNRPISGYIDFVEISISTFAFLGIAYCQRVGGHVRMELFLGKARGRPHYLMEIAATLGALLVVGVLTWFSFDHFLRAYELGDSTIDAQLPVWPSKLIVPVSFGLLWLRLLVQLFAYARLSLHPQAEPVAVPRALTPSELAARELEAGKQRG